MMDYKSIDLVRLRREAALALVATEEELREGVWLSHANPQTILALLDRLDAAERATGAYAAAARVIALWLKEFCDEKLPYDEMVAEASRRAAKEIEVLRAAIGAAERERDEARADAVNQIAWNSATREQFNRIGRALDPVRMKRHTGEPSECDGAAVERLCAENERLRADAERLQWVLDECLVEYCRDDKPYIETRELIDELMQHTDAARKEAVPGRGCAEPAPDGSGRRCDKPKGHAGDHWTYGGRELTWAANETEAE